MKLSEPINIFGKDLLLSQRSIKDIIDASNFSRDNPDPEESLFINSFMIHCGLKVNVENLPKPDGLPFYRIFEKRLRRKRIQEMEHLISVQNIMSLTIGEIIPIAMRITDLDYGSNGNSKKKVESKQT